MAACGPAPPPRESPRTTEAFAAIETQDVARLRQAVAGGADLGARDARGRTLLMAAARKGNAEPLQGLRAPGADLDQATPVGRTALILAARGGSIAAVRALIR